jgi:hypothetical protein
LYLGLDFADAFIMKFVKVTLKYVRRFAWALVMAYMIAWHNVYKERADMVNTIEYHMEDDHRNDASESL